MSIQNLSTITAISRYGTDKLLILDGSSKKIHIINDVGEVLLTLDAQGEGLEQGDIRNTGVLGTIYQVDSDGTLFTFRL